MNRIAPLVAGRRAKFGVLVLWLLVIAALGPFIGKFESVQENEPSSFLPGDAESVRVLQASDQFPGGEYTDAIVVFRNPDGLGVDGRRAVHRARDAFVDADIRGAGRPSPARRGT